MTDYNALKVPDLKKLLGDRSLPISGNKADLIARLQEDDKKPSNSGAVPAATGEDEIDWDEDDTKATNAPAAAAIAAGGQGPVDTPVAVPNQKSDIDPAKTDDLTVTKSSTAAPATSDSTAAVVEAPKLDLSIGLPKTDAEKEAERRAARAKRFGLSASEEEEKKAERAKKFGLEAAAVVQGLDDALPERRKRGREGREEKDGGRSAKKQTPDRRTENPKAKANSNKPNSNNAAAPPAKKSNFLDDPAEKAKAEARAKRFQTAA